jgi:hypothetical protein
MTDIEQRHIRDAYCFELGKVTKPEIRARVVNEIIARFDAGLPRKWPSGSACPRRRRRRRRPSRASRRR